MTAHPVMVGILLGTAAGLTVVSAVGMALMRDVYQRLHFVSPVSVAALLVAAAVWVSQPEIQAGGKATLCAAILFVMNGVLGHATARAARGKRTGRWAVEKGDVVRPEARRAAEEGGRD